MFWHDTRWDSGRERIREVKEKKPGYRDQLEFAESVLEAQFRTWEVLASPEISLAESEIRTRLDNGFVLVDHDRLRDIPAGIGDLALELARIVSDRKPEMREEAESFLRGAAAGIFAPAEWLSDEIRGKRDRREKIESALSLGGPLLAFISYGSLRPLWMAAAAPFQASLKPELWQRESCPACGQAAVIGELRNEEGVRYLVCTRCGTEWRFPRIRCISCGNTDISALKYLFFDEEPGYRIDVCHTCRTMHKIMDSRKLPQPVVVELEDLVTPHLDYLAVSEGYSRKVPNILGFL